MTFWFRFVEKRLKTKLIFLLSESSIDFLKFAEENRFWLKQIDGFRLIRPVNSVFESEMFRFRETFFEENRRICLAARKLGRKLNSTNRNLISSIELEEFGVLLNSEIVELRSKTKNFDQNSIESIVQLTRFQLDETINLFRIEEKSSIFDLIFFRRTLRKTLQVLKKRKEKIFLIENLNVETNRQKFNFPFFLVRNCSDEIFRLNENESADAKKIEKISLDLKIAAKSLDFFLDKQKVQRIPEQSEQAEILSSAAIKSFHRFDDEVQETNDEILIGETGRQNENEQENLDELDDFQRAEEKILREQTRCLFDELHKAIESKKQRWNEREQTLFGRVLEEEKPNVQPQVEEKNEKFIPVHQPVSIIDELKRSLILNRPIFNTEEDLFEEE